MSSFDRAAAIALAGAALAGAAPARAQDRPQGFASERLYTSAPGGGWFVMDALDMRGGWGGAVSLTGGYAHDPVRVASQDGTQRLDLVADQAFATLGAAATYDRFRLYFDLTKPMASLGDSGTVGGLALTGPSTDAGKTPDLFSDIRVGLDARVLGAPNGPFRAGAGLQLFVPSGGRDDFVTDGNYRAMARALFAGDVAWLTYAAHVGVHVRDLDDAPVPGSPRGSELVFGAAAGARLRAGAAAFVLGPELFGASALRELFGKTTTALEGLFTARFEAPLEDRLALRVKLGPGAGLSPWFGAPEWRFAFALELSGRARD